MSGSVVGGWEFVIAVYVLSALVLTSYCISVLLRERVARRNAARGLAPGSRST